MRSLAIVVLAGCASSSLGYIQPPPSSNSVVGLGSVNGRLAVALQTEYQRKSAEPPMSLVPTDGSELVLTKLAADLAIAGPIAHTELQFSFKNAENRSREGRFSVTLPTSAAVTRFAMKINGEWREARVVSRQKGREVYERFLHRNIDPALLEQDLGNVFSARVFPIGPLEDKEIILAYDEQVSAANGHVLALNGLPKIGELTVHTDNNGDHSTVTVKDGEPHDLTFPVTPGTAAVASGEAFVARIEDVVTSPGDAPLERVLYLVDTSASRAPVMAKQTELLFELLMSNPNALVTVAVFDQTTVELFRGPAQQARNIPLQMMYHGALGASNLGAALERATTMGMSRVVIIGDGVATAGEHDAEKLAAIVRGSQIQRIDAVQVGQQIDRTVLEQLVRAGKTPGAIFDGNNPQRAIRQLTSAIPSPIGIEVDGVTAYWPKTTANVALGEPLFVFGLRKNTGPIVVRFGARIVNVTPRDGHERLRRTVARAELADLLGQKQTPELGDRIEQLALAYSLVSPRTSLIVLESLAQEQRFLDAPGPGLTRNVPTGRTFQGVLSAAAGAQSDSLGVSFSGATSLENQYIVDGVNVLGLSYGTVSAGFGHGHVGGELLCIMGQDPRNMYAQNVSADVMSPMALDLGAASMRSTSSPFGEMHEVYVPPSPPQPNKPYRGEFHQVMKTIAAREPRALEIANDWHVRNPGDVAAIIALGEALEANGAGNLAARAYGSIADLYPNRAELLRVAAERLDRTGARTIAIDFYQRAIRERPDHVTTYRLLAWALFRANRADEAIAALTAGLQHAQRASIARVLADDASVITANIVARHPERRYEMQYPIALEPTLRFTLSWETDATDVDLDVHDATGAQRTVNDDIASGYGPETVVVANPRAFPYKLSAHYADKGAMGIGMGTVQIIQHDGKGGVIVEDRPFVIQNDNARINLGMVTAR